MRCVRTEDCKVVDVEFCMANTTRGEHGSGTQHGMWHGREKKSHSFLSMYPSKQCWKQKDLEHSCRMRPGVGRSVNLFPGDMHDWGCPRTAVDREGEACARKVQKGT